MSRIGAGALAIGLLFILHGIVFLIQPSAARERMSEGPLSPGQFRLLGAAELAGGLVMGLSSMTVVPPLLTASASAGIAGVLVPASILHVRRREWGASVATALAAVLTAVLFCDAVARVSSR